MLRYSFTVYGKDAGEIIARARDRAERFYGKAVDPEDIHYDIEATSVTLSDGTVISAEAEVTTYPRLT